MRRDALPGAGRRFASEGETIESSSGDLRHESFEWRWTPQLSASRFRFSGTLGGCEQRRKRTECDDPCASRGAASRLCANDESSFPEAIESRSHRRKCGSMGFGAGRYAGGFQQQRSWRDLSYLVHDLRADHISLERDCAASVLGRQFETEHRNSGRGLFRSQPRTVCSLSSPHTSRARQANR